MFWKKLILQLQHRTYISQKNMFSGMAVTAFVSAAAVMTAMMCAAFMVMVMFAMVIANRVFFIG